MVCPTRKRSGRGMRGDAIAGEANTLEMRVRDERIALMEESKEVLVMRVWGAKERMAFAHWMNSQEIVYEKGVMRYTRQ